MARCFVRWPTASALSVCFVAMAIVLVSGCDDGISDYDRAKMDVTKAMDAMKAKGVKFAERRYPQGDAWSVDLSGQQISDETFELLKRVGRVSELNFSGSTLTDAQAEKLNSMDVSGFVVKL